MRTLGLLGDKVIDISIGTPRYGVLRPGDTIAVAPSLDYEAVLAQAAGAVTDMVDLTHDLRKLTGGIVAGEGTIGQLVTNRALYDQFVGTMARANTHAHEIRESEWHRGASARRSHALQSLRWAVIGSADSLVVALNNKDGTIGKLLRDDSLYVHFVGHGAGGRFAHEAAVERPGAVGVAC